MSDIRPGQVLSNMPMQAGVCDGWLIMVLRRFDRATSQWVCLTLSTGGADPKHGVGHVGPWGSDYISRWTVVCDVDLDSAPGEPISVAGDY